MWSLKWTTPRITCTQASLRPVYRLIVSTSCCLMKPVSSVAHAPPLKCLRPPHRHQWSAYTSPITYGLLTRKRKKAYNQNFVMKSPGQVTGVPIFSSKVHDYWTWITSEKSDTDVACMFTYGADRLSASQPAQARRAASAPTTS